MSEFPALPISVFRIYMKDIFITHSSSHTLNHTLFPTPSSSHTLHHTLFIFIIICTKIGNTLTSIAKSVRTFADDFAKVESNYLHIPILNDNLFGFGSRGDLIFDDNFFQN